MVVQGLLSLGAQAMLLSASRARDVDQLQISMAPMWLNVAVQRRH